MKKLLHRIFIPIFIALSFLVFSCNQQKQTVDIDVDIAAIKETMKKYEAAANAGDLDSFISLWAEEGVRMPTDAPSRLGVTQIIEELKPIYDQFTLDIKIASIDEARVFGDIGITRCNNISLAITPKAGGKKIILFQDAKALTIHKRQLDGNWKIIYDCFNSNLPLKSGTK